MSRYFWTTSILQIKNNIDFPNYESATNINAIIVSTLLSKMAMNPNLSWNDVLKFLNDCFKTLKTNKTVIQQMAYLQVLDPEAEINFSLYDLSEASELAKDKGNSKESGTWKHNLLYVIL